MTTWNKLFQFAQVAAGHQARTAGANTKLKYAIERVSPQITKAQATIQQRFEEIDVDHCATDDKGIVTKDAAGQFQFTKEELKARNRLRNAACEDEIEFEPYFATKLPDDLTEQELDAFVGIVIKAEDVEAIRAKREASDAIPEAVID